MSWNMHINVIMKNERSPAISSPFSSPGCCQVSVTAATSTYRDTNFDSSPLLPVLAAFVQVTIYKPPRCPFGRQTDVSNAQMLALEALVRSLRTAVESSIPAFALTASISWFLRCMAVMGVGSILCRPDCPIHYVRPQPQFTAWP